MFTDVLKKVHFSPVFIFQCENELTTDVRTEAVTITVAVKCYELMPPGFYLWSTYQLQVLLKQMYSVIYFLSTEKV